MHHSSDRQCRRSCHSRTGPELLEVRRSPLGLRGGSAPQEERRTAPVCPRTPCATPPRRPPRSSSWASHCSWRPAGTPPPRGASGEWQYRRRRCRGRAGGVHNPDSGADPDPERADATPTAPATGPAEPDADEPDTDKSDTAESDIDEPNAEQPDVDEPDTEQPDADEPEQPDASDIEQGDVDDRDLLDFA